MGLVLLLERRTSIKCRHTNTVENCSTVAVKEKLGGLGKKSTSSKHLWRTNRDAKDSHLCLRNHLLSLAVSVSLALTLIHCSFFTYAPFVPHKIQAWQLRILGPFGWNICSACGAFYKSAEPRWSELQQWENGFKQRPYVGWCYRMRRIFIVNVIFQGHLTEVFCTVPGFVWFLNYRVILFKAFPSLPVDVYFCEMYGVFWFVPVRPI